MAIFKKSPDGQGSAGRERTGASGRAPGEGAISIIGPGMRIVGDLDTDGTVRVEGTVEGTIRAGRAVVLGTDGEVVGDVYTQDAVIGGRIRGRLTTENRLELQGTSVIEGEIRARSQHLQLHEGARFNGQIKMIDEVEEMKALPAETAPPAAAEA